MNKNKHLALIVVLLLALVACSGQKATLTSTSDGGEARGATAPSAAPLAQDRSMNYSSAITVAKETEERMIVRTAQLSLVVRDAEASLEQVKTIVSALEGYMVDTRMWREDEQMRGSVTVRVPSASLDDALARFKELAIKVQSENGSSQDVTEEYSDLGAQLRNLEATEQELLELLKTVREKTGKAEDILAVHRELTSIRGQIEQLKGRMQYLERTTALAAVSLELIPDVLAKPVTSAGWRPAETLKGAARALVSTLQSVVEAAIWIVIYVLPVLVVLLIPFGLIWFLWRRRRKAKKTSA